jgi:hypothetical protein
MDLGFTDFRWCSFEPAPVLLLHTPQPSDAPILKMRPLGGYFDLSLGPNALIDLLDKPLIA